jgi:hypothetical protein
MPTTSKHCTTYSKCHSLPPIMADIDKRLRAMPEQYVYESINHILPLSGKQRAVLSKNKRNTFTQLHLDVRMVLFSLRGIHALLEQLFRCEDLVKYKINAHQLRLLLSPEGINLLQSGVLSLRQIFKYNISAQHLALILSDDTIMLLKHSHISFQQLHQYNISSEKLELLSSNAGVALLQANILSLKKIHEKNMSADEIYTILRDWQLIIYLLNHCNAEHKDAMCEFILSLSHQERERFKLILEDMLTSNIPKEIRLFMMQPQAIPLLLERWVNVNDLRYNVDLDKLRLVCNRKGLDAMRKHAITSDCFTSNNTASLTHLHDALNGVSIYKHLPHLCLPPSSRSSVSAWRTR